MAPLAVVQRDTAAPMCKGFAGYSIPQPLRAHRRLDQRLPQSSLHLRLDDPLHRLNGLVHIIVHVSLRNPSSEGAKPFSDDFLLILAFSEL